MDVPDTPTERSPILPRAVRVARALDPLLAHAKVASVVAPAGSGKSRAVQEWLSASGLSATWYRAGEADAAQGLPEATDAFVVIDDLYLQTEATPAAFAWLTAHPQRRLVVIDRDREPADWWRFFGRGEAVQLTFDDLRLDVGEARTMAAQVAVELSHADVEQVHRMSAGWPALTRLLLQARAEGPETGEALPWVVQQYLTSEVIGTWSDDLRATMARAALLGSFTMEHLDFLVPSRPGASAPLAHHLHVLPLVRHPGAEGVQWEMPPVLIEALSHDPAGPSPEEREGLHRRASRWHESRGEWDAALGHMLQASPRGAVTQLTRMIGATEAHGPSDHALAWFRQLPASERNRPGAMIALALALVQARMPQEAEHLLSQADVSGWEHPDQVAEFWMVRSMVHRTQGDHDRALEAARRARTHLAGLRAGENVRPSRLAFLQVMTVEQVQTMAAWDGDAETVRRLGAEVNTQLIRPENGRSRVHGTAIAALTEFDAGDLPTAEDLLKVAQRMAEQCGLEHSHVMAECELTAAALATERGADDVAVRSLRTAREHATRGLFPSTTARVDLMLARALTRTGEVAGAEALLDEIASDAVHSSLPGLGVRLLAARAVHLALVGDRSGSLALYSRLSVMTSPLDVVLDRARLAVALETDQDLPALVQALLPEREPRARVAAGILRARMLADSDRDRAVQLLAETLRLAESFGHWQSVVDLLVGQVRMVHQVEPRVDPVLGPTSRYVRGLAAAVARVPQQESLLSARESEISQFLPSRKTNAGIAAELFISENTVKTHVRHIYQKLGVETRQAAVERLEELGLLQAR